MTFQDVTKIIGENRSFLILTHRNPDGDTLGSAFALAEAIVSTGRQAHVLNSDGFPQRYDFLYGSGLEGSCDMEAECVIAVDVADPALLGGGLERFCAPEAVDLCIDHHASNTLYARNTLLEADSPATALILYRLFDRAGITITGQMAACLYTGIATDTGCFKYENTTPDAHRAAARLIELGADYTDINRRMFDLKSRSRLLVEQLAMSRIEYAFGGRMSMIVVTRQMIRESGADESEFEGLAALPLNIEGVIIGITVKERQEGVYKLSVRTTDKLDACLFCRGFGGGGHIRAAGCEITGELCEVKERIRSAVKAALDQMEQPEQLP